MSDVESLIYNFTEVVESFRDTVRNFDSDLENVSSRVSSLEETLAIVIGIQIICTVVVCLFIKHYFNKNNRM